MTQVISATERGPSSANVYTPSRLAKAIVAAITPDAQGHWLEPCVGDGSLVRAIASAGVPRDRITGVDLESTQAPSDSMAQVVRGVDFVAWVNGTDRRFDYVVANPPYVSIGRLPSGLKKTALEVVMPNGRPVPLGANYWCAFLCQALNLLRPGASLAFILPAAWEYADYAGPLRDGLPKRFRKFETHRSEAPLFDSVQDGSIVIIGRGYGEPHVDEIRARYPSADELVQALDQPGEHVGQTVIRDAYEGSERPTTRPLRDVMTVSIGAVTGDAPFFLMSESDRLASSLPARSVVPAVTHARDLVSAVIDTTEWNRLRGLGRRVWLFRPPDSILPRVSVQNYLSLARDRGGCNRDAFKVRGRAPWYRPKLPSRPDGFLSGMSRVGPWVALRGLDGLTASNTLYVIRFKEALSLEGKAAWCLSMLATPVRERLASIGRRYPDGLLKYEPSDLRDLELIVPPSFSGGLAAYSKAVSQLLSGNVGEASRIADDQWRAWSAPARVSRLRSSDRFRPERAGTHG